MKKLCAEKEAIQNTPSYGSVNCVINIIQDGKILKFVSLISFISSWEINDKIRYEHFVNMA